MPGTAGNAFRLTFPASTIYAESADSRREDNIWVFDTRFERTFSVTDRIRFRGFLDFFNITNSHSSETITRYDRRQLPAADRHPRALHVARGLPAALVIRGVEAGG